MKKLLILLFLISTNCLASLSFQWSGIAGIYLTDGKTSLFFDPVFSRPNVAEFFIGLDYQVDKKMVKATLQKMGIKKLDAIFIGHTHFDHALDMHVVSEQTGGIIYGSQTTGFVAKGHGIKDSHIRLIKDGQIIQLGDFKIEIVKSKHGLIMGQFEFKGGELTKPLNRVPNLSDYRMGGSYSFYISHPDGDIFVQQATRTTPRIQKMLHGKKLKALFQGLANRKNSQDLYSGIIKHAASIETIIPIHHDNFFVDRNDKKMEHLWGIDLQEFVNYSKSQGQKVLLPQYFQSYNL